MELLSEKVDPGQRHGTSVYYIGDGYSYHQNTTYGVDDRSYIIYLRCKNYRTVGCKGTARLYVTDEEHKWVNCHPHVFPCIPIVESHDIRMLRREALEECRTNVYENPRRVLNRIATRYPVEVAARARLCNFRHSMRRARMENFPNIPANLDVLGDLLSSPAFTHLSETADGSDNLYCGTVGPPGAKSVVFVSRRMLRFLSTVKIVFADATFLPTPALPEGKQVYQIVTVVRNKVIPMVVAIMDSKSYEAYLAILLKLQEMAPGFNPTKVLLDFERSQMRAWLEVYNGQCKVVGCYVHFIRASLRNVGRLGLLRAMRNDNFINTIIYSLLAIPLLPHGMMKTGLMVVLRVAQRQQARFCMLLPLFDYFIRTWMRGLFYQTISIYGELHRTNNPCESAHRLLQYETGPHHPNLWAFLNALRMYEHSSYADVYAYTNGLRFGMKRRVPVLINDVTIRNYTKELRDGSISVWRFLRRCSSRMVNLVDSQM